MKTLFLTSLFLLSSVFAHSAVVKINVRDDSLRLVKKELEFDSQLAESEHFRVLKGTENEVMDLTDEKYSEEEREKAATVLYHLNIARNYFIDVMGSEYVKDLPKLSVRVDMSKPFSEFYRFLSDSKNDQYNNAVTVPASGKIARRDVDPWNIEIWFRPPKDEEIDNKIFQAARQLDAVNYTTLLGPMLVDQAARDAVIQEALYNSLNNLDYMSYVTNLLSTLGLLEVTPKVVMYVFRPMKVKSYLDTAMVPEIVYHEFSHVALSDHISLRRSTGMNEGIANYFAAVINGHAKVGAKTGKYSKNVAGFDGDKKVMYDSTLESERASYSNFVFSFLWGLRKRFGSEMPEGEKLFDKIVYASRTHVNFAKKSIKDDLIQSLIEAVDDVFPTSKGRKMRLLINDEARKRGV